MNIFIFLLLIILASLFIRQNIYENAVDNIPTRFCRPTRFFSPYDYRGLLNVPTTSSPLVFEQSEAVGENVNYCFDEVRQTLD